MNVNIIIKIQSLYIGYLQRKKCVIEPCSIDEMIHLDINKLKHYLINDYLTKGRIEYYKSTNTQNYILEDGFMEYIIAKSINGKRIGEGHTPLDVIIIEEKIGIDVMCLSLNGNTNYTNEKSIMQNFREGGKSLDELFKKKDYIQALQLYKKDFYKKLLSAKEKYNIEKLYYISFISCRNKVYISLFRIHIDAIVNVCINKNKKSNISIYTNNFIHEKYGCVKLYKSKKRLELRLHKNIIDKPNTINIY